MSDAQLFRIEFLGPSGSGKSTIAKEVIKQSQRNGKGANIRKGGDVKQEIILNQVKENWALQHYLFKTLLKVPSLRANLVDNNITTQAWKLLEERSPEFYEFITHATVNRPVDSVNSSDFLKRQWWFIKDVTDLLLIEESAGGEYVLHDQFLLQKGLSFAVGAESQEFLKTYTQHAPLPDLLVYINVNYHELRSRIENRGVTVERQLANVEHFFNNAPVMVEELEKCDAPIVKLDGMQDVAFNAGQCISAIKSMG